MGSEYRRPIEEILAKVTSFWQLSQPVHMRHLAIVKDSIQRSKHLVYIYYTFEHYRNLVAAGQKTWEAVLMLQDKKRSSGVDVASVDAPISATDAYNLPSLDPAQFQGHDNDALLSECIPTGSRRRQSSGTGAPARNQHRDRAAPNNGNSPTAMNALGWPMTGSSEGKQSNSIAVMKGRGRPRKYQIKAEIPADIETWDVEKIKRLIESRRMSDKYQKLKITDEIERRVGDGEEPQAFAHQLLEATDESRKEEGEEPLSRFLVMEVLHKYAGGAAPREEDDVVAILKNILKDRRHFMYPQGKSPRSAKPPIGPSRQERDHDTTFVKANMPSYVVLANGTEESSQPDTSAERLSSAMIHKIMSKTYERAAESIRRPTQGVSVSRVAQRYKRRDDPALMTTRLYQVALFRLAGLCGLEWFHSVDSKTPPSICANNHTQERNGKTSGVIDVDLDRRPPSIVPGYASDSSSVLPDRHGLHRRREQGASALCGELVTTQDETDRFGRPVIDIAPIRCTSESGTQPHTRPPGDPQLFEQSPPNSMLSGPIGLDASQAPPKSGAVAHRDVPSTTRPVSSRPNEDADVSPSLDLPRTPVAKVKSTIPRSKNDLGFDSHAQSLDHPTNHTSPFSRRQDPTCFVFKLPGLKDLAWFRDKFSPDIAALPNHQEMGPPLQDKLDQVPHSDVSKSRNYRYSSSATTKQSPSIKNHLRQPSKSTSTGRSGRGGGSTAILRRDIIIDLVQRCGGVFPESGAMRGPFGREWKARGQPGLPDRNTVTNAVNVCCEQGKLRRIVFSFKDRHGVASTSTVFALPEIASGDPRIKEIQEMIKQCYPQLFIPKAAMPKDLQEEEMQNPNLRQVTKQAHDRRARVEEARSMASKPQEEREAYIATLQFSNQSEQEKKALSRLAASSTTKVQRLSTLRTPVTPIFIPHVSMEVHSYEKQSNRQYSAPLQDQISQRERQGIRQIEKPTSSSYGIMQPLRPNQVQREEFSVQSQQSRHRLRESATREAQTERSRIFSKSSNTSNEWTKAFDPHVSMPSEHATSRHTDKSYGEHDPSGLFLAGSLDYPFTEPIQESFVSSRKRKRVEDEVVFPGFMYPVHMFHRATGTFSASFPGFRVGIMKPKLRARRKATSKVTAAGDYQSPYPLLTSRETSLPPQQQDNLSYSFPGVTSPEIMHSLSGTFAAKFLGFKLNIKEATNAKKSRQEVRQKPQRSQNAAGMKALAAVEILGKRSTKRQRRLSAVESNQEDRITLDDPNQRNAKRRRGKSTMRRNASVDLAEPSNPLTASPIRLRRVRGPQTASAMGEDGALRLFVAVTVVRVLTGGLRQNIDWGLVSKVFAPKHDEAYLRARWSSVLAKMRHNQVRMDADFQTLFARAYEEGTVPELNFERLDDYDWKWLVEWTMTHLDTPTNTAPELLADRAAFDQRYTLNDASQEKDLTHFFELEGLSVKDLRTSVINRQAYSCLLYPKSTLFSSSQLREDSEREQVAVARSWIRANIVTPAETYDSETARAKLSKLATPVVETALQSLLQEKVLIEKYKTRVVPGRDYEISDFFRKRLRTNILPAQFYRALAFKRQLDHAFEIEGKLRWSQLAPDGDAMAVFNLLTHQRIQLVPINPPLNKWGHTDDGYATRQMDKSRLNFDVDIVPTSAYTIGNPLEPLPPPPAPQLSATSGHHPKIPIWYDINDDLVVEMWPPTLAAVLALLAVRTGANAAELQTNVRPSLEVWEVEKVLQWMVTANVAERVGREGYKTKEWWWLALQEHSRPDLIGNVDLPEFSSTSNKPKAAKRRYHRAERQEEERLEQLRSQPQNSFQSSSSLMDDQVESD